MNEEVHLIGDFFKLHFIENNGAAFGLTIANLVPGMSDWTAKLILTLFSFFAVFFIIYILKRAAEYASGLPIYVALILGGAFGNIIDRMFYGTIFSAMNDYEGGLLFGRVVDMFYLDLWQGFLPNWIPFFGGNWYAFWPIFNIADAAISIGIVGIFIFQRQIFSSDEELAKAKSTEESETKDAEVTTEEQPIENTTEPLPVESECPGSTRFRAQRRNLIFAGNRNIFPFLALK